MNREQIKAIALQHGFTLKQGGADLMLYVYEFAEALIAANQEKIWALSDRIHELQGELLSARTEIERMRTELPPAQARERVRIAKWFEKRAEDYAMEYGHDDMGGLTFGTGHHAEVRQDYHSELLENAKAIRAMGDER
jgi:hypothetical protein